MISYLKGILVDIQKPGSQRIIVTLDVNQIGYDLQIPARILPELPPLGEPIQLFSYLQMREDQVILFGFSSGHERDLFRQLISVSGIGPQMAMALIDTLGATDLIQAVVSSNTRLLSRTPGVGSKTAERIVLELKTKLSEWRHLSGVSTNPVAGPTISLQEDVEITLLALGYTSGEILQALQAVGQSTTLRKSDDSEAWVREAISWLSR